jgi:hypothetical protein
LAESGDHQQQIAGSERGDRHADVGVDVGVGPFEPLRADAPVGIVAIPERGRTFVVVAVSGNIERLQPEGNDLRIPAREQIARGQAVQTIALRSQGLRRLG